MPRSLCEAGVFDASFSWSSCLDIELGSGAVLTAIGLPMLIVGAVERSRYKAWRSEHPYLSSLALVPLRRSVGVGFGVAF